MAALGLSAISAPADQASDILTASGLRLRNALQVPITKMRASGSLLPSIKCGCTTLDKRTVMATVRPLPASPKVPGFQGSLIQERSQVEMIQYNVGVQQLAQECSVSESSIISALKQSSFTMCSLPVTNGNRRRDR